MSGLTHPEIVRVVNRYISVSRGYLGRCLVATPWSRSRKLKPVKSMASPTLTTVTNRRHLLFYGQATTTVRYG